MLEIGTKAPELVGVDENGNEVSLNDFKGKKLVLYFTRRTALRDVRRRLATCGTTTIGILRLGIRCLVSARTHRPRTGNS